MSLLPGLVAVFILVTLCYLFGAHAEFLFAQSACSDSIAVNMSKVPAHHLSAHQSIALCVAVTLYLPIVKVASPGIKLWIKLVHQINFVVD